MSNLLDECGVVGDAVGAFESLSGHHSEEVVEVIADGKQLAFALLVGGGLVQVDLKLLLDRPAVLWSAQEREDTVQPWVFQHDVAEFVLGIQGELVC